MNGKLPAPCYDAGCYDCRISIGQDVGNLTTDDRCDWHDGFEEGQNVKLRGEPDFDFSRPAFKTR